MHRTRTAYPYGTEVIEFVAGSIRVAFWNTRGMDAQAGSVEAEAKTQRHF